MPTFSVFRTLPACALLLMILAGCATLTPAGETAGDGERPDSDPRAALRRIVRQPSTEPLAYSGEYTQEDALANLLEYAQKYAIQNVVSHVQEDWVEGLLEEVVRATIPKLLKQPLEDMPDLTAEDALKNVLEYTSEDVLKDAFEDALRDALIYAILVLPDDATEDDLRASIEEAITDMLAYALAANPLNIPSTCPVEHPKLYVSRGFAAGRHKGIDLICPRGTPITASADGTVTFVGTMRGYGKIAKVDHSGGFESWYAHLDSFAVSKGDFVVLGQTIGEVGQTGRATTAHLHYEVRENGEAVDPEPYMPGFGEE